MIRVYVHCVRFSFARARISMSAFLVTINLLPGFITSGIYIKIKVILFLSIHAWSNSPEVGSNLPPTYQLTHIFYILLFGIIEAKTYQLHPSVV